MAYAAPEDVASRLAPDASARSCDTIRGGLKGGGVQGAESAKDSIVAHCQRSLALGQGPLTLPLVYEATALSLRDVLLDRLRNTEDLVASSVRGCLRPSPDLASSKAWCTQAWRQPKAAQGQNQG